MRAQLLKIRTKEVLYEKYRTEKLLARRATRNISEDETRRLLEGASVQLRWWTDVIRLTSGLLAYRPRTVIIFGSVSVSSACDIFCIY